MKYRRKVFLPLSLVFFLFISCAARHPDLQGDHLKEPRLMPLAESEWDQAQADLLSPLKQYFADGKVINILSTVARNPTLLDKWLTFSNHILQTSTLPARDREILILRIGWLCRSEYEFGQHTIVGK